MRPVFPWSQYESRVRELAAQGLGGNEIAACLIAESGQPLNVQTLRSRLGRMKLKLGAALKGEAAERREKVKALWNTGHSSGAIAVELGITRAAVMGVVHRLKLAERGKPPSTQITRRNRNQYTANLTAIRPQFQRPRPPRLPRAPKPEAVMPHESTRCSILDLTFSSCRWIMGDSRTPLEPIYCGGKASTRAWGKFGKAACPYCDWHANMALAGPARDLSRFKAA